MSNKIVLQTNKYEVDWKGFKFYIEKTDNNINLFFDGNINLGINGEVGIVSTNNLCIDTLNSKIYLNSRKSNQIKNDPESLEYVKQQEKELEKRQFLIQQEHDEFVQRIEKLENQIRELKCQVQQD